MSIHYIENFKVNKRQKIEMKAGTFITDRDSFSLIWLGEFIDCSPPGHSVHRILQARILKWVSIPVSRGSSQPRDQTMVSRLQADFLLSEPPGKPWSLIQKKRKPWTCRCVDFIDSFSIALFKISTHLHWGLVCKIRHAGIFGKEE